jgi:WD40 repeat protein
VTSGRLDGASSEDAPGSLTSETAGIFISYSRRDQAFVRRLDKALADRGRDPWVDWEDIPPTARWREEVKSAIVHAQSFVLVLSPDSVASRVCTQEIAHAVRHNKRIVPIVWRDIDAGSVPPAVAETNWIFARSSDDFDAAVDTLIQAFDTDLAWVKDHTRLLVRAIEWDQNGCDRSFLLRGRDLQAAERWLTQGSSDRKPHPTALHSQYLVASRAAETRRRTGRLVALSIAFAVAIVLAIAALVQRNEAVNQRDLAERQRRLATSRGLAAQATAQLDDRPDRALLLAIEALRVGDTVGTRASLLRVLQKNEHLRRVLYAPGDVSLATVAFSPASPFVAAGTETGGLVVWDVETGRSLHASSDEAGEPVIAIAFSPTGRTVASLTEGGTILTWKVTSQSSPRTVGHVGRGLSGALGWSPDGDELIAVNSSGVIHRWRMPSGRALPQQRAGVGESYSWTLSPDGSLLASNPHRYVRVWRTATGGAIGRAGTGPYVAFSADGLLLASGGPQITLSDLRSGKERNMFESGSAQPITAIALSPGGELLAVETEDDNRDTSLFMIDTATGRLLGGPQEAYAPSLWTGEVLHLNMSFGSQGHLLATMGPDDHSILIWDALGGLTALSHEIGRSPGAIDISPDGRVIATSPQTSLRGYVSSRGSGQVTLTDVVTGRRIDRFTATHEGDVNKLSFSPDSSWLAVEHGEETTVFDVSGDGRQLSPQRLPGSFAGWGPDGQTLAVADIDGVTLWEQAGQLTAKPLAWPGGWNGDGVAVGNGGDIVALPGRTGVAIYEVASGRLIDLLEFDRPSFPQIVPGTLPTMALDPAGGSLVLGTSDSGGRLLVWNLGRARHPMIPAAYQLDEMWSVAYSPDGALVATAGARTGIDLWDGRTRKHLGDLATLPGVLGQRLAFSSDGRWLTSIQQLNTRRGTSVRVLVQWDVNVDDWIATACLVAGRSLNRAEWQRFVSGQPYHPTCAAQPGSS